MDKPTIFFSHSSKDRDIILPIRNKIVDITGGTMEIFMSSDGQSIPLGRNWVSKIEEGLKNAQIMFIFVTPNSIKSDWIYFEAGYAYSKEIEVIPVGVGVHIGELRAPLNLLQGFDILSWDSLNNFISVINKKFNLSFKEAFNESDYVSIQQSIFSEEIDSNYSEVFSLCSCSWGNREFITENGNYALVYDIEGYYNTIKNYLGKNHIQYACSDSDKILLADGMRIVIRGGKRNITTISSTNAIPNVKEEIYYSIVFHISLCNLKESFKLLLNLSRIMNREVVKLYLKLNDNYNCLSKAEELSSFISLVDKLGYSSNDINEFIYNEVISWYFEKDKDNANNIIHISFKLNEVNIDDVVGLISCLCKVGIIYRKM